MFQQFMQMGAPAALTIVGVSLSFVGLTVAMMIANTSKREDDRKFELDRMDRAAQSKLVEHKRTPEV